MLGFDALRLTPAQLLMSEGDLEAATRTLSGEGSSTVPEAVFRTRSGGCATVEVKRLPLSVFDGTGYPEPCRPSRASEPRRSRWVGGRVVRAGIGKVGERLARFLRGRFGGRIRHYFVLLIPEIATPKQERQVLRRVGEVLQEDRDLALSTTVVVARATMDVYW